MRKIRTILGDNIRSLRIAKDWTQAYLAERLGITASFLTMIESGRRGMSLDLLEATAEIFVVPVASLFLDNTMQKQEQQRYFRTQELNNLERTLQKKIEAAISESILRLRR